MWESFIRGFRDYLLLERGLSRNAIEAYTRDVKKLAEFMQERDHHDPSKVDLGRLQDFLEHIQEKGLNRNSQSRIISGLRQFFRYLQLEEIVDENPAKLLDLPKKSKSLPDVLSTAEIDLMISHIDLSSPLGLRNKTIIELLYASGMRVSELVDFKISQLYLKEAMLRIIGKGNKERIVPIHDQILELLKHYLEKWRNNQTPKPGEEDFLFLNKNGRHLTRIMIFYIIKDLIEKAGIKKNIYPHSMRHSFATHLVENGADLRVVQLLLGHESITTTEMYSHLDRRHLRETLEKYHPKY